VDEITFAFVGNGHQAAHAKALAKGMAAHGVKVKTGYPATQHVACWGWRRGKVLRDAGHDVLVLERGYLGDRFAWTSLAWNGLNNRGTAPVIDDGGERFNRHHDGLLQPENHGGDYALIIGQVPGDASLQGLDLTEWYADQAAKYPGARFRPHPLAHRRAHVYPVTGADTIVGTLQEAMQGASLVVTYNSNAGVDALLAGKRIHVEDCGSMAWQVGDRETWAHQLAWRQWSMAEIESGAAWEIVRGR
jgi:hypothetical protein